MDINKIKYYTEKFYIRFDGENVYDLIELDEEGNFSLKFSLFLHEYYHFLTNISTFQGLRAFNVSFQDKIRIITIIQNECGLDGFPLSSNHREDCKKLIHYWESIDKITFGDSALRNISLEIDNSPSRKVSIKEIILNQEPLAEWIGDKLIEGERENITVVVDGIVNDTFTLPIAAIDEFLSSSIDQYLFETANVNELKFITSRLFYPYHFFDEILKFYGLIRVDPKIKIIIAYKALHASNPVKRFIDIIHCISLNSDSFFSNPTAFLEKNFKSDDSELLRQQLYYLDDFRNQCIKQGRRLLSYIIDIIYERGRAAKILLEKDPYYFIRPLIDNDLTVLEGREKCIAGIKNILTNFDSFLQLQEHNLVGIEEGGDPEKRLLAVLLAISEILKNVEKQHIVERTETEYELDKHPELDRLENLPSTPPFTRIWHNALNETSFYKLYLDYRKQPD